jgi:hypothetical protein
VGERGGGRGGLEEGGEGGWRRGGGPKNLYFVGPLNVNLNINEVSAAYVWNSS